MTGHIYIKKYTKQFDWDNATELPFEDYTISESDFRNRTAKFTTNRRHDLTNHTWAVKIVNDHHETFTGIILKKTKKPMNLIEYDCQDWNRLYMSKPVVNKKASNYKLIKFLIKNYCQVEKIGLLSANKYEQRKYGSVISFNPMKNKNSLTCSDKTVKEIVQQLIYSTGAFIDIHYNNTGIMKFTPYHKDDWLKPVAEFHYMESIDYDWNFNTTDIVTLVHDGNKNYTFKDLFGGNALSNMVMTIENTSDSDSNKTGTNNNNTSNNGKTTVKTGKTSKTNNPYGTKKKEVWIVMDTCWGSSTDQQYMNRFAKELAKLGWKVNKRGIGPGGIIPSSLSSDIKNGVYLILANGVDCEVFRHIGHDQFFKGMLLRRNCRAAIGLINNAGDIRKGGRYYKHLGMAHDGTGKGNPGLNYPAGYLAYCGVPFFYSRGNNPKKAAVLFDSGGESKLALNKNYSKVLKGYYSNWNWGNKY